MRSRIPAAETRCRDARRAPSARSGATRSARRSCALHLRRVHAFADPREEPVGERALVGALELLASAGPDQEQRVVLRLEAFAVADLVRGDQVDALLFQFRA